MKYTGKALVLTVLAAVLLAPALVEAAPSITGVSGDLVNGQNLTITGAGFGVKSPAAPVLWENFESGALEASFDFVDQLWQIYGGEGQEPGSKYSLRVDRGNGIANADLRKDYVIQDKLYTYVKRRWDFELRFRNQKFFRVWGSTGVGSVGWDYLSTDTKFQYFTKDTSPPHVDSDNPLPGIYSPFLSPAQYPEPGRWQTDEFFIKLGSAYDVCDGVLGYAVNGSVHRWMPNNRCTDAGKELQLERIFIDNFGTCEGGGHDCLPTGSYVWVDDIYIDNTWARVVIGNQAAYDDCTEIEIQPPVTWDDVKGEIVVTLNQGAFDTLDGKYIFVVNDENNPSAGFLLGNNTPPKPGSPRDIRSEGAVPSTL